MPGPRVRLLAHHEHGAGGPVGDGPADAAERPQPSQPAAADHEKVVCRGPLDQRRGRRAVERMHGVEGRAGAPAELAATASARVDGSDSSTPTTIVRGNVAIGAARAISTEQAASWTSRAATLPRSVPGEPTLPVAAHGDHVRLEARSLDCEERRGGPGAERRRHLDPARDVVGPRRRAPPRPALRSRRSGSAVCAGMTDATDSTRPAWITPTSSIRALGRGEERGLADGLCRLCGAVDPADDRREDSRRVDRRYPNGVKLGHVASVRARRRRGIGECPNRTVDFHAHDAAGWRSLSTPPLRRYGRVSVRAEPEAALP